MAMKKPSLLSRLAITTITLSLAATLQAAPFGGAKDVSYANSLWKALERAHLVGSDAIQAVPYAGQPPHGKILVALDSTVTVHNKQAGPSGDTGVVIIKRNYGGSGVTKQSVANHPYSNLKAVTVMFKRKGYDPADKDWFWVKFKADGGIYKNKKNMVLAGRVAKGMSQGCIACHSAAPGGDLVFNNDRFK